MPDNRERPTDTRTTPTAANASAPRGSDAAVTPPDPPIVPASTDAEAAGTPPDPATRAAAPDAGPRTPAARDAAPDDDQPDPTGLPASRTTPSLIWLAVVLVIFVLLLLSLWSGT